MSQRVLIVEDEETIRDLLRELLELRGYAVETARNGQEALTLLRAMSALPDLILLDLMMPVMDGRAFLEARKLEPRFLPIPVILLTATGDKATVLGAAALVRKPFRMQAFMAVLEKVLPPREEV